LFQLEEEAEQDLPISSRKRKRNASSKTTYADDRSRVKNATDHDLEAAIAASLVVDDPELDEALRGGSASGAAPPPSAGSPPSKRRRTASDSSDSAEVPPVEVVVTAEELQARRERELQRVKGRSGNNIKYLLSSLTR
jgi:hypothetical protein